MKRLNLQFLLLLALCVPAALFTSCSDDDKGQAVSKTISGITISKLNALEGGVGIETLAILDFSYDTKNGQIQMNYYGEDSNSGMSYRYKPGDNYIYTRGNGVGGNTAYDIELNSARRLERMTGYIPGNYRYFYKGDCVSDYSLGNDIDLKYTWAGGNWSTISVKESLASDPFVSTYSPTSMPNNYNLDLNLLSYFMSSPLDVEVKTMDMFLHFTGLLGRRSANLVEDKLYRYSYMYDGKGRISQVLMTNSLLSSTYAGSFVFSISYQE